MLNGQQKILESINAHAIKSDLPRFNVGDTIGVHFRIVEGDKERTQLFQGVVISRTGRGINEMVTARKIVDEVGVERIFPINSPMVAKIEIVRRADARRSKLYYLRDRTGKSRRLRDRRRDLHLVKGERLSSQQQAATPAAEAKQ